MTLVLWPRATCLGAGKGTIVANTPLEALDDAIHRFLEATDQGDRAVSGWVLGVSTSRIHAEDDGTLPLITGAQYAMGPQTSTTDAAGIVRFLDVVYERATYRMLNED